MKKKLVLIVVTLMLINKNIKSQDSTIQDTLSKPEIPVTIEAEVNKEEVTVGEPFNLIIRKLEKTESEKGFHTQTFKSYSFHYSFPGVNVVSGGGIKFQHSPEIKPTGKQQSRSYMKIENQESKSISEEEISFVVDKPGEFTIGPFYTFYEDPKTHSQIKITAPEIKIKVVAGKKKNYSYNQEYEKKKKSPILIISIIILATIGIVFAVLMIRENRLAIKQKEKITNVIKEKEDKVEELNKLLTQDKNKELFEKVYEIILESAGEKPNSIAPSEWRKILPKLLKIHPFLNELEYVLTRIEWVKYAQYKPGKEEGEKAILLAKELLRKRP